MTIQEAFQILHQIAESLLMNGADRDRAREAAKTLVDFINSVETSKTKENKVE